MGFIFNATRFFDTVHINMTFEMADEIASMLDDFNDLSKSMFSLKMQLKNLASGRQPERYDRHDRHDREDDRRLTIFAVRRFSGHVCVSLVMPLASTLARLVDDFEDLDPSLYSFKQRLRLLVKDYWAHEREREGYRDNNYREGHRERENHREHDVNDNGENDSGEFVPQADYRDDFQQDSGHRHFNRSNYRARR